MRFERRLFIGFGLAVLILVALGYASFLNNREYINTNHLVVHTTEVLYEAQLIQSMMADLEARKRGFELTGNEEFLSTYQALLDKVDQRIDSLEKLTMDNSSQRPRLARLKKFVSQKKETIQEGVSNFREQGFVPELITANTMEGKRAMDSIVAIIAGIQDEENKLLRDRLATSTKSISEFYSTSSLLLISTTIVLVGIFAFIQYNLRIRARTEKVMKELNQELQENVTQLNAVNKELDSFTYSVSHDLRAPLRSIDGYSKIILEDHHDKLDEEGKKALNIIVRNAVRMGQLIDDLLHFSKISKRETMKSMVDMREMSSSVSEELIQERKLAAEIKIGQLHEAYGDPSMLKQVWVNLISNALKYSARRDQILIEINSILDPRENTIVYSVKDNGVGFDMQYANKLFGVFQRLHKNSDFEGTGVGLAIVHRIITRHGGRIWVDAKPDQGATFLFSIPKQQT